MNSPTCPKCGTPLDEEGLCPNCSSKRNGFTWKKLFDRALPVFVLLVLLASLGKTVFLPKDINLYENRPANKLQAPTISSILSSDFQQSVEDALNDQVLLSQTMKKGYNILSNFVLYTGLKPILERNPNQYIYFRSIAFFDGYITYPTRTLSNMQPALDAKAANYNDYFAQHPELEFFLYFIEKDTDIDFRTGAKVGAYEYLRDQLTLPADHTARFEVNSIDQFQDWFYVTDHHWNYRGSYKGYQEVAALLGTEDPLEPVETVLVPGTFSGSKATVNGARELFEEEFTAYRFEFPEMTVTINGQPAQDYGKQELYLSGQGGTPGYSAFYGGDNGETIFDTHQTDKDNLLIIGESYDNAILKLLASDFNKTFSVDLRYYETAMGKPFALSEYAREHGITKILLIGNIDYFIMAEFDLEG